MLIGEDVEGTPSFTKSYPSWVELVGFPPVFRMLEFKMFNSMESQNQQSPILDRYVGLS